MKTRVLILLSIIISYATLSLAQNQQVLEEDTFSDDNTDTNEETLNKIEVENLIGNVYALPPEIAASSLIRIAKSKMVSDAKRKEDILETAFQIADDAKHQFRKKVLPLSGSSVDTSSGYISYAFDQKLDKLSLKSEIIKEIHKLNPQKAFELIQQMPEKLSIKKLNCEDSLVYDLDAFYEVIELIAKQHFSNKEVELGQRGYFLAPYIENIESHAQLKPSLELIISLKSSDSEKLLLENAIVSALKNLENDDRSFSYSIKRDSLSRLMRKTSISLNSTALLDKYKNYLLKNLNTNRCKDNEPKNDKTLLPYIVDANHIFHKSPITIEDIKPVGFKVSPKINSYWNSANSKKLLNKFRDLKSMTILTNKNKVKAKWQSNLFIYIRLLEEWKTLSNEQNIDVFRQKSVLYLSLIDIAEDDTSKKHILNSFITFLNQNSILKESAIDWNYYLKKMISKEKELFSEVSTNVSNPVLSFYADMNRLGI